MRASEYTDYMRIHHDVNALHHPRLLRGHGITSNSPCAQPLRPPGLLLRDKVRRPVQHDGRYYFDTAYNRKLIRSFFGRAFTPEMSFPEFTSLVARIPDWLADAHFKSQTAMLYSRGHRIRTLSDTSRISSADWEKLPGNIRYRHYREKRDIRIRARLAKLLHGHECNKTGSPPISP